jgi:phenylacetate-CoA ligase
MVTPHATGGVGDEGSPDVPEARRRRNPLMSREGYRRLVAILEHPDAPAWNYEVGDRVGREDIGGVEAMRQAVRATRPVASGAPPRPILDWVARVRPRVPLFREMLPAGFDIEAHWTLVPTMGRRDLAVRIEDVVPADEPLDRLIVYDTSGVTGHAIRVPHHPAAIAQNHALMEYVLEQHGVRPAFSPDVVACVNVGAQVSTVVFATAFSVWNDAGFAKVNLHPRAWDPTRARRFLRDLAPIFLTGDPLGYAEMLAWGIEVRPAAMISTAVALLPGLKARLEQHYRCPVIDTYATTETGPVGYATPGGDGLAILPPDIHVEVVDVEGRPVPEGEMGEICVTGGRNPFVPLLRYRTGDFARLRPASPLGGDPAPRLVDLQAREAVAFRADDGTVVSPVDVGRVLRAWAFVQHAFVQRRDGSCDLAIRPAEGCPVDTEEMVRRLRALFGESIPITARIDDTLGDDRGGKVVPFRSEGSGHDVGGTGVPPV